MIWRRADGVVGTERFLDKIGIADHEIEIDASGRCRN
jgi:hypothetical protein